MRLNGSSSVPTLETERLKLRSHQVEDFTDCAAMWSDPEIARYTVGTPSSEQQTWRRLLAYVGHWSLLGFGYWAVEEKATGRFVGELGFADFKRDMKPSIDGKPELGWALARGVHGQGYATEALRAAVAWGDTHFKAPSVCIISPDNLASLRVAEKLGYKEQSRTIQDGKTLVLFARGL
jgi:RimJ/RimL family protein N-acetyltransferase